MHKHVSILLFFGLVVFGPVLFYPATPDCLSCHREGSIPKEKAPVISEEKFKQSVHNKLACLDCHRDAAATQKGHEQKPTPVNCTLVCHQESARGGGTKNPRYYEDSVHGRAVKRGEEAARCRDCHGKHNILAAQDKESSIYRSNIPRTCSTCHEQMAVVIKYNIHQEKPYSDFLKSVHGRGVFQNGLIQFTAVCTDCHGVHDIAGIGLNTAKSPQTCGKCHIAILDEYMASIHGREYQKGNPNTPVCTDCHGEHSIRFPYDRESSVSPLKVSDTCSTCHARPEIMGKYGLPKDRIDSFLESIHGIAIGLGYRAAANCTSCHGIHNILPATDPLSAVHPRNLRNTCGQTACHPRMSEKIAGQKIHRSYEKKGTFVFWLKKILIWAVIVILIITMVWVIPDIYRRIRGKKEP